MNLAKPARLAGSVWELARSALLLAAAARLAGGEVMRLVPLLVPLAAPGLVLAAAFAASALLADSGAALAPLLRLGKVLELASAPAALAAALVAGSSPDARLIVLLAAVEAVDIALYVMLLSWDRDRDASAGSAPAPPAPPAAPPAAQ
jgi:hypothetical protein